MRTIQILNRSFALALVLVRTFIAAAQEMPATAPASQPQAFEQRLRAINATGLRIKDLTADFVQEKQSPLLRKPLVSRGTIAVRGDTSLWNTREPEPM